MMKPCEVINDNLSIC